MKLGNIKFILKKTHAYYIVRYSVGLKTNKKIFMELGLNKGSKRVKNNNNVERRFASPEVELYCQWFGVVNGYIVHPLI